MKTSTATAAATLTLALAGLVGATAPASATEPDRIATGSCSEDSTFRMLIQDLNDSNNATRIAFNVYSDKPGRVWSLTFTRDDGKTFFNPTVKDTNENGVLKTSKIARTDKDTRFTVVAEARYGEVCKQSLRLVPRDRD